MFDGSDTSLGNVTNWAYSVKEYLDLAEIPAEKQTRMAAIFLDKDMKTWYRNNYVDVNPSPAIDVFLEAFKSQFLVTHSADDIIKCLRLIQQGSDPIGKYSTSGKLKRSCPLVRSAGTKPYPDSMLISITSLVSPTRPHMLFLITRTCNPMKISK